MDTIKIGEFLSQLRREQGLTQEQLGEELGVSNKTVSRWENGNYLPPVEMLQSLSLRYGVSINELLSGERLPEEAYREQAEQNIKSALKSSFSIKEKLAFYKKKWRKEHRASLALMIGAYLFLLMMGMEQDGRGLHLLAWFLLSGGILVRYNAMMAYAEGHVFGNPGTAEEISPGGRIMKRVRITGLILLAMSIWITVDLTINYVSALVPELNDGITVRGMWSMLFYGADGHRWSILNFYNGFVSALRMTGFIALANILITCHWMESK